MLKCAAVKDMNRSRLLAEKRLPNAIVKCEINDGFEEFLSKGREYEAYIRHKNEYIVITDDISTSCSYPVENFTLIRRINLLYKFIDLLRWMNKI